jgi:hypothetical protein
MCKSHQRRPDTSTVIRLESFHFELTTVFLQPPPLVRVFFRDCLLLLLTGGCFMVVEAMDEGKGVSSG